MRPLGRPVPQQSVVHGEQAAGCSHGAQHGCWGGAALLRSHLTAQRARGTCGCGRMPGVGFNPLLQGWLSHAVMIQLLPWPAPRCQGTGGGGVSVLFSRPDHLMSPIPQVDGTQCVEVCVPETTCDEHFACGSQPNGCGGQIYCGECGPGYICELSPDKNSTSCKPEVGPPCVPSHECPGGQKCGVALDPVCGEQMAARPAWLATQGRHTACGVPPDT